MKSIIFKPGNKPNFYVKTKVNGREIRRSTGQATMTAAKKWVREHFEPLVTAETTQEIAEVVRRAKARIPMQWEEVWPAFAKAPKRKAIGAKAMEQKEGIWQDFRLYMSAKYPQVSFMALDREHASDYLGHLETAGRFRKTKGKGASVQLSSRSRRIYHNCLDQILEYVWRDAGLPENPFKAVAKPRVKSESRDVFTESELADIMAADDPTMVSLFCVGLYTGLRRGDLCQLRWNEVDLASGWIRKTASKTKTNVMVPILPPLRRHLETLPQSSEWVMPLIADQYERNSDNISRMVRSFLNGLGIKCQQKVEGRDRMVSTKGLHSLRHTLVWLAAKEGVPIPILKLVVGHMSESMTRHYADHANQADVLAQFKLPEF